MSLVIKKFLEGGSPSVRTYKRGNDEVDLNSFINTAINGLDDWLDNAKIKKKYKDDVRTTVIDMLNKINDNPESFVSRLGGGFDNTHNITNAEKGFDVNGVAAGYLGKTLRLMQSYIQPKKDEKPKDITTYSRDGYIITPEIQALMLGEDPINFIMLDPYDENTRRRGLANRNAELIRKLTDYKSKNKYNYDSEEDRLHFISRIDNAISTLQNNNPNDDWFTLGLLGFKDLGKYFYTGINNPAGPLSLEEELQIITLNRQKLFENYVNSEWKGYNGPDIPAFSINSTELSMSDQEIQHIALKLSNSSFYSNDALVGWLLTYLNNRNTYDVNKDFGRIYNIGNIKYNTNLTILLLIQEMAKRGLLTLIDNTKYVIPSTRRKEKGTAYVYDSSNNSLQEMSIHDIPYYQLLIWDDFTKKYPATISENTYYTSRWPLVVSNKKGGILKFYNGGPLYIGNIGHTNNYNYYLHGISNWILDLLDAAEKALDKLSFADLVNSTQANHALLYKKWDHNRAYKGTDNDVSNYLLGIIDNFGYVNTKGISNIRANNYYIDPVNPYTSDNAKNNWKPDDYFAALTDDRRVLGREGDFNETTLNDLISKFKDRGYEMYLDDSDRYYKLRLINTSSETTDETSDKTSDTTTNTEPEVNPDNINTLLEKIILLRNNPDNPYASSKFSNFLSNIAPNLFGAGRLAGSLLSNNRIARTVREGLLPKLHTTYELYSPVTGKFGEMQFRSQQGADLQNWASKPFTSSADLSTQRMINALSRANDLKYQGFLADDQEIRRTKEEALKRQEDNIRRRSDLINYNRDQLIDYRNALVLLEASRIKQNWQSVDNYLQGIENNLIENRNNRRNFALTVSNDAADNLRKTYANLIYNRFLAWLNGDTSKTYSDWVSQNYDLVSKAQQDIEDIIKQLKYQNIADIYGYRYNRGTKKFSINDYKFKKGGKLSADLLINKVVRNNENNS